MERIESAFSMDVPARDASPWLLRPHRAGDISFVTQRMIASAQEEFDLAGAFETVTLGQSAQFLGRFSATDECSWIAERDGAVVGSVVVRRVDDRTAELSLLHVESRARGIGIGRRLIAEAVEFAARAGYQTMQLELLDVMKTARRLLHAAGFRHVSEVADARFGKPVQRQTWSLGL